MTSILSAAASGMQHQQTVLDIAANNLANVRSSGFQRSRVLAEGAPAAPGTPGRLGVSETTIDLLIAPGEAIPTADPLHFAMQDDAFLRILDFDGEAVLTRAAALTLDGAGQIITPEGRLLEPPVALPGPGYTSPAIGRDGAVTALNPDGEIETIGQIELVKLVNPAGLQSLGGGLFREGVNSGAVTTGTPGAGSFAELLTGAFEGSNVDGAREIVSVVVAQRAYQANARTFSIGDQMLEIATDLTA